MTAPSARVLHGVEARPHVFGPLDGSDTPDAPPAPPAEPEPPTFSADALDAAREEAREAGRRERDAEVEALRAEVERLADERAEATRAADAHAATVAGAASRLAALWAGAVRAFEPDLCALAVDVAEGVLGAPLSEAQRDAARRALADAVDGLAGSLPVTVRLHPVALLALREAGLAEALEAQHALRWEPDDALGPDEWAVETDEAAVRRLRGPAFAALRDRLGLDAVPPADAPPDRP